MARNGLAPLDLSGAEFETFVANSIERIAGISRDIGILQ